MYAVKGFPSIETSTRPAGSFGRTRMRSPGAFCCAATLQKNAEITMRTRDAPALGLLMRRSSSQNDRLLCVVETDPQIGRASCRKECRSRWSPYHYKNQDDTTAGRTFAE